MSTHTIDQLKIKIIQCPYKTFQLYETQTLFSKFIALKLKSFREKYNTYILPAGKYDFIATIVLVFLENLHDPIMTFKLNTFKNCQDFSLQFEIFDLLNKNNRHIDFFNSRIQNVDPLKIIYASSWSVSPVLAEIANIKNLIRIISAGLLVKSANELGYEQIYSGGTIRSKVPDFFKSLGFESFRDSNNLELEPIKCPFLSDEATEILHLRFFSNYAIEASNLVNKLWNERVTIQENNITNKTRKAA